MKKFTLILLALMATTLSFAKANPTALRKGAIQPRTKMGIEQADLRLSQLDKMARKAPRRIAGMPIEVIPEGKVINDLIVSFNGEAYNWGIIYDSSNDAGAAIIVEGTDGNLYIHGILPRLYDTELFWIKAEKVSGDEYVIKRQLAGIYADWGTEDYFTVLEPMGEDDYVEAKDTELKVKYKDGVLTQVNPEQIYGIVYQYEDEWVWEGEAYWNLNISPLTETYTELPEGAVAESYVMEAEEIAMEVKVATVGNKMYLRTYESVPGWFVGDINDNKVSFKSAQFLGMDSYYNMYMWLMTAKASLQYNDIYEEYYYEFTLTDGATFDYNPETKTLTAPANTALLINASKKTDYYAEAYVDAKMYPFVEVAAVPADPAILGYDGYDEDYGFAYMDFEIPTYDVNGNFISPSKLAYKLYVDDELFTFDPDEYDVEKEMTEISYNFTDDYGIGTNYLALFFDPAKNVGLQSVYRGGNAENLSNIAFYDIVNDEFYTLDKDGKPTDGIILSLNRKAQDTVTYDLTGRRVADNARGLVIKTITSANGTQKTIKVLNK